MQSLTLFSYVNGRKHSFNAFSEQTLIKTAVLCNLHMTENTIRCLLTIISRSNISSACSSYDGAFIFTMLFVVLLYSSTIKVRHKIRNQGGLNLGVMVYVWI